MKQARAVSKRPMMNIKNGRNLFLVILIGAVGVGVSLAGWRGRMLELDMLPFVDDAIRFLENGVMPVRGSLLSMGAYNPPLSTWLYMPGVAVFDNPGLYVIIGSGVLYVGTLIGIYMLTVRHVGVLCAFVAVLLFAFSKTGLHFAVFIGAWTFFVIWALYFASRWIFERDGRYLAAGLFVWGLGMYNMMVIAPLFFVFPVLWLLYRPPVTWKPLAVALVAGLVIASPYIADQAKQDFSGLTAQLTRRSLIPADFEKSWCNPGLRPVLEKQLGGLDLTGQSAGPAAEGFAAIIKGVAVRLAGRLSVVALGMTGNFNLNLRVPFLGGIVETVLAVFLIAVFFIGLRGDFRRWIPDKVFSWGMSGSFWLKAAGIAALVVAALANEILIVRFLSRDGYLWPNEIVMIRQFQGLVGVAGLALLFHRPLGRLIKIFNDRTGFTTDADAGKVPALEFFRFLGIAFFVPALILFLIATPGRDRYFQWLWPIESIALAVFSIHVLPRLSGIKKSGIVMAVVLVALIGWPSVLKISAAWSRGNFAGKESPISQAVSYIGETLVREGRSTALIGYNVPFSGYQISYNVLDSRYKVGAAEDFLLRRRYGIKNANTCAEGIRADDEFRIVREKPQGMSMAGYFEPPATGFKTVAEFGIYRVIRRKNR